MFLDGFHSQLLVHTDQQLLGFGIHIAHVYTPLVVEEDIVPFSGGIDADIELLRLSWEKDTAARALNLLWPDLISTTRKSNLGKTEPQKSWGPT